MAETIISPGVLARENDQTFILESPIQAGAAIIGPTVRGKIGIPTICTSYSDFVEKYGTSFESGSQNYTYFTSISAFNYFNSGGTSLLVTRVVSGSTTTDWTPATSSRIQTSLAETQPTANINLTFISASVASAGSGSFGVNGITFFFTGSNVTNTSTQININTGSFSNSTVASYVVSSSAVFNLSSSVAPYSSSLQTILSSNSSPNLTLTHTGQNALSGHNSFFTSGSINYNLSGGVNTELFILETLAEGKILNSVGPTGSNDTLLSGSTENYRWEIQTPDINDGTFSLLIRQGNDSSLFPSILETWGPLSLDPNEANYIEKVIGNQIEEIKEDNGEFYIQLTGEYLNQSQYVRVKSVLHPTPEYFDNNGTPKPQFTSSIPITSSGVFGDGKGSNIPTGIAGNYYENISNTNIQGLKASDYTTSISLLANKDAFKYNFITTPGLVADPTQYSDHTSTITQLIDMVQNRADTMTIIDLVGYNSNILPVLSRAQLRDTSYAAAYWPWVKTLDPNTATQAWIPASTLVPSVYAQNDNIAFPWFAPAGVNRGVMPTVIQTERVLTQGNRDDLYKNKVNPIATLSTAGGAAITVFGQKTLQKRKTSLDRVNVRRLLIELKTFISQIADGFVFEQNTETTRNNFLSEINPYLSTVQQQQGLTSFQVIMDETNNTPNVIDNNQLVGQIYLQPTRTAEFIILDFNILPTGATFPT
tara:strand:- start:43 stop:2166 length:2124 start_codon:yes stop_codon:yes gene_type:complete